MELIENSDIEYLKKSVIRLSMKVSKLSIEDISIIKKASKKYASVELKEYAQSKKVLPFVAKLFLDLKIEKDYWSNIYTTYEKRNTEILSVLKRVFNLFKEKKINKIFLYENFGALLASDSSIGSFASGDVDLYSDAIHRKDVVEILSNEGFYPKKTNKSTETVKTEFFNSSLFETGFGINIMWKPLSRLKLPFQIDINNSIDWHQLINYKNSNILIPEKEALMYLCLLHTSVHGYHRSPDIRLYTDTDRVALLNPDWNIISSYAKSDRTEVRVAASSILSNKMIDTSLPLNWKNKYLSKYNHLNRLINRVYDSKNNYLKDEPKGLSVLLIEILSSDSNCIKAGFRVLFPNKTWIREYYLHNNEPLITGYIRHIKNLL